MHNITSLNEFFEMAEAVRYMIREPAPDIKDKGSPGVSYTKLCEMALTFPKGWTTNPFVIQALKHFGDFKKGIQHKSDMLGNIDLQSAFKELQSYFKMHTKEVTARVMEELSQGTKPLSARDKQTFLYRGITIKNKFAIRLMNRSLYIPVAMVFPTYEAYDSAVSGLVMLDPAPAEVSLVEALKEAAEEITVHSFLNRFIKLPVSENNRHDTVTLGGAMNIMLDNYTLAYEVFHMVINPGEIELGKKISKELVGTGGGRTTRHDNIVRLNVIPWVAEAPEKHIGEHNPFREVAQILLQDPDALAPYMQWLNKRQAALIKQ